MSREKIHLTISKKRYGGSVYGSYISKLPGVKTQTLIETNSINRFVKLIHFIKNLYRFSKNHKDSIVIRNLDGCFFMRKSQKNIAVFHHYHPVKSSLLVGLYQRFAYWNFLKKMHTFSKVVVVSRYWHEHFEKLGFYNTKLIYNPFEIELYRKKEEAVLKEFVKKYHFDPDKPIVYIGNPQKEKGADIAYEALKELDIQMVTTGIKQVDLPVKHLELSFDEYIILLQASSVSVLMSRIEEGWNRVALESVLCGTPVVGSGRGGMGELLVGAKQYVCDEPERLEEIVQEVLQNPVVASESLEYARSFSVERFNRSWEELLDELEK